MTTATTEPIGQDWTTSEPLDAGRRPATVAQVCRHLALLEVVDIDVQLRRFMAAAGAELALGAGIRWYDCDDDPPVVLLRLISRAAIEAPQAGGPHTDRLLTHLVSRSRPPAVT